MEYEELSEAFFKTWQILVKLTPESFRKCRDCGNCIPKTLNACLCYKDMITKSGYWPDYLD